MRHFRSVLALIQSTPHLILTKSNIKYTTLDYYEVLKLPLLVYPFNLYKKE